MTNYCWAEYIVWEKWYWFPCFNDIVTNYCWADDVGRPGRDERLALDPRLRRLPATREVPEAEGTQGAGRVALPGGRLVAAATCNSRITRTPRRLFQTQLLDGAAFLLSIGLAWTTLAYLMGHDTCQEGARLHRASIDTARHAFRTCDSDSVQLSVRQSVHVQFQHDFDGGRPYDTLSFVNRNNWACLPSYYLQRLQIGKHALL